MTQRDRDQSVVFVTNSAFTMLALGLIYTQVLNYDTYFAKSQNNFIRIIPIDSPRGRMVDRNGNILVGNRLSFDISCVYQETGPKDRFINSLSSNLGVQPRDIIRPMAKARERPFAPYVIAEDVEKEKAIGLEEMEPDLRGLVVETRSKRDYVLGESGAQIFGYLGEINEEELASLKEYGYRMRNLMGRSGLEKYYNNYLTGVDGGEQIEVDSRGKRVSLLGLKEPRPGRDLRLTIDVRLQLLADRLLGEKTGAIIVMDPRNGEILAMASHPDFDPSVFVRPGESEERSRLLTARSKPLLNRAISGLYPPGSVFKIAVAAAALEMKRISGQTHFSCPGHYSLGRTVFHCWKDGGHGSQNILEGMKNSCNVFFFNTGRAAGVDGIESYAAKLGFGRPTGVDLPEEAGGLVPGRLWKLISKKDVWYEGETVNYAIGQGYLLVTPIQVIRMTAAIANGGRLVRPYLVRGIGPVDVGGEKYQESGISAATIKIIKEGMFKVVQDENGTGRRARVEGLSMGAKTGTAENPRGAPHAWFTGFAPWQSPKLSVVILIEHGGKGGMGPAEMAKEIFEGAKGLGLL